jgi:hypothetical protein
VGLTVKTDDNTKEAGDVETYTVKERLALTDHDENGNQRAVPEGDLEARWSAKKQDEGKSTRVAFATSSAAAASVATASRSTSARSTTRSGAGGRSSAGTSTTATRGAARQRARPVHEGDRREAMATVVTNAGVTSSRTGSRAPAPSR